MALFDVSIKGQRELLAAVKKTANPNKLFDPDVRKTANDSLGKLIRTTPRDTGTTGRSWFPRKIKDGLYINTNNVRVGKLREWVLVNILNKGRRLKKKVVYKGTQFIDKEQPRAIDQLVKLMLKRLDKI